MGLLKEEMYGLWTCIERKGVDVLKGKTAPQIMTCALWLAKHGWYELQDGDKTRGMEHAQACMAIGHAEHCKARKLSKATAADDAEAAGATEATEAMEAMEAVDAAGRSILVRIRIGGSTGTKAVTPEPNDGTKGKRTVGISAINQ